MTEWPTTTRLRSRSDNQSLHSSFKKSVVMQINSIQAADALSYCNEQKENIILLDVRTPREFREQTLENSLNIPIQVLPYNLEKLDKNKEIVCFCLHGVRSGQAAHYLLGKGFTKVSHIESGLSEMF